MPKAYWIARVTVIDADAYKGYADLAPVAFKKFGARILARGGRAAQLEGEGRPRNVVIEFPSYDEAVACYHSPEYQAAKAKRTATGAGIAEIVIVEGAE
jgi:uncharacterized protein (DUF1330 family)